MKIAVVALTRGYPKNKKLYDTLIQRNNSIYKQINQHRKIPADVILFHEGNISDDDQNYISSHYPEKIIFKDISKFFLDKSNLELAGEKKFNLGYRQMCRFNMYHIWEEVDQYDYILRVDEDVEIIEFDPYVFESMYQKKIIYLTGRFTKETHPLTNSTLPLFLKENTDLTVEKVYNHRNPYTNVFASKVDFWKQNDVWSLLKSISLSENQLINRWGDHTVQGIVLNHKKEKIRLFPKLEYKHISHDLIIKNNFLRNMTVNSKFNPIWMQDNMFIKIKFLLKKNIKILIGKSS